MSEHGRRFFAGNTLAQAVAAAARHFGVEPAELAYRVREKRHGFLKIRRPVVLEVDPAAPRRVGGATGSVAPPAAAPDRAPAPPARAGREPQPRAQRPPRDRERHERQERRERGPQPPEPRPERAESRPARAAGAGGAEGEAWRAADEEAAQAAGEAMRRLLQLAGLELAARVRVEGERLEIELNGADEERLRELGLEFLEDLEHLLPRVAHGLCGKLVRVRVEGAGLRAAREAELRALARAAAERVVAEGRDELLAPLDPAERRIVHLELQGRGDVVTESVGTGFQKRVRVTRPR